MVTTSKDWREVWADLEERGLDQLVMSVVEPHAVTIAEVCSHSSMRHIARARWAVWDALRAHGLGSVIIGKMWSYDHTTVLYGTRRWVEECDDI